MMNKYLLIAIILSVVYPYRGHTQVDDKTFATKCMSQDRVTIHFRFAKSVVDIGYMDNELQLRKVNTILSNVLQDTTSVIDSLVLTIKNSPEGPTYANETLSKKRADAMKSYIYWKFPKMHDNKVIIHTIAEDWSSLRRMIAEDQRVPKQKEALEIIDFTIDQELKEEEMRALGGGAAYNYIRTNFLQNLRCGEMEIYCYTTTKEIPAEVMVEEPKQQNEPEPIVVMAKNEPLKVVTSPLKTEENRKLLFAIKTNLLYDLAMTPNLEVEVPIGKHWSINAEYQYGWWLRNDNSFCWQLESGGVEGRYWFGDRENKRQLTGWFAGVFVGGGMFDFQLKKDEGYQGEFYILGGASGGYAMPLNRHFNLEFSVGLGYIMTDYRRYNVIDNELIKQGRTMRYQSILPAKAKVSLVWLLHSNKKGERK